MKFFLFISKFLILAVHVAGRMCPLPQINNGRIIILGQTFTDNYAFPRSFAVVKCKEGFVLANGAAVSQCEEDGGWGAALGTCAHPQLMNTDCSKNLEVENGYIVATNQPQNFKIECQDGFTLTGASTIYCFDDKSWTLPGKCEHRTEKEHWVSQWNAQCYIPDFVMGMISVNGGPQFLPYRFAVPPGTRVKLICAPGFMVSGGSSENICVGGVIWSPEPPNCIPIPREMTSTTTQAWTTSPRVIGDILSQVRCELPPTSTGTYLMNSGSIAIRGNYVRPGVSINLRCHTLFEINGGNGNSLCQIDGTWSHSIGSCVATKLQNNYATSRRCYVVRPPNGSLLMNGLPTFESDLYQVFAGTRVTLQCQDGFEVMDGPVDTYCRESGSLMPLLGRCTSITTTQVTTTTIRKPVPSEIQQDLMCRVPQSRFGSVILDKVERRRALPALQSPHHVSFGIQVTLRCYTGYVLNGPSTATCLESGYLSETLGDCLPSIPQDNKMALMDPVVSPVDMEPTTTMMTIPQRTIPPAVREKENSEALINAAKGGDGLAIDFLIANGADTDYRDDEDRTALMWAASLGNLDIVQMLLEHGAKIDTLDSKGYTPLLFAIHNGRFAVVRHLIKAGANVDAKTKSGITTVILAVQNSFPTILQLLLLQGADVDDYDSNGATPLIWAARKGSQLMVEILLKYQADANAADYDGETALMFAARYGYNDVVERLLDGGADINAQDANGFTAAMHADLYGRLNTIPLLQHRARVYNDMIRLSGFDYQDNIVRARSCRRCKK